MKAFKQKISDAAKKVAHKSVGRSVPFIIHESKVPKKLRDLNK